MFKRIGWFLLPILLIFTNCTDVFALPSDIIRNEDKSIRAMPGHGDIAKMAAELKYDRNDNGLRSGVEDVFGDRKGFSESMGLAATAEDRPPWKTLTHFYDPTAEFGTSGYLGMFQNARDRADGFYKDSITGACKAIPNKDMAALIDAWKDLLNSMHLAAHDMATPAHTNNLSHLTGDSFEKYVKNNWESWDTSTPQEGRIPNFNGLKEYLQDQVSAYDPSMYKLDNANAYTDTLSGLSHSSPVDTSALLFNLPITWEEKRQNAEKLLKASLLYSAGMINTFWDKINPENGSGGCGEGESSSSGIINTSYVKGHLSSSIENACGSDESSGSISDPDCDSPPETPNPANDHSDDRFDVSDEFYYESNFNHGHRQAGGPEAQDGREKSAAGIAFFVQRIITIEIQKRASIMEV